MSQNLKLRIADGAKDQSASESEQPAQPPPKAGKPTKVLPTVRVSFGKQMDVLRAYAAVSSGVNRLVSLKEVADVVQMAPQTLSLANPFFVDIRLVQRSEGVGMAPSKELLDYAHAYQWDPETAAQKIAPLLARTWFWEALQPRLAWKELPEDQAVTLLSEKASAGPTYKSELRMILEFLKEAGMIRRENGYVRIVNRDQQAGIAPDPPVADPGPIQTVENQNPARVSSGSMATNFGQELGVVSFDIRVRVDMSELAGWDPARITAFFQGIAQVVSAKGSVERKIVDD